MSAEDTIKRGCVKLLKKTQSSQVPNLFFYCPTDRFYSGIPDIVLCYKGRWAAAELKTLKGKVTPIQKYTLDLLQGAGAEVAVCRSVSEFAEFLMIFMMKINTEGGELI